MNTSTSFRSFSPACDLQSKRLVWSLFRNQEQAFHNEQPIVETAVRISSFFSQKYA